MSKVELIKNGRSVKVDARVADHLLSRASYGYMRRDMVAAQAPAAPPAAPDKDDADEKLTELRAQYQKVVGKKAYHGWSAEELEAKIREQSE